MILTVTLNAAIDRTVAVPSFRQGHRHRAVEASTVAGGPTGTRIVEQLTQEAILNDFVRIREESRTNTAVLDPTTGEQTEINERGPAVTPKELELFRDKLVYLARGAEIVVFAGSLPRGVEPDYYAELLRELHKLGVTTIVDTDGEPLRMAVRAEPTVISPNVNEAEELVGHEFNDEADMINAVRELGHMGPREAIMTTPDGCVANLKVDGESAVLRARIDPREAIATVGSGDAFLAGFVAARYGGRSPEECLAFGVACGADSIRRLGAGLIDPREVDRLVPEVEVARVSTPAGV